MPPADSPGSGDPRRRRLTPYPPCGHNQQLVLPLNTKGGCWTGQRWRSPAEARHVPGSLEMRCRSAQETPPPELQGPGPATPSDGRVWNVLEIAVLPEQLPPPPSRGSFQELLCTRSCAGPAAGARAGQPHPHGTRCGTQTHQIHTWICVSLALCRVRVPEEGPGACGQGRGQERPPSGEGRA